MTYRWILFDADDTLFHFDAYQGLRRMFERHAVDFTPDHYVQYQEINKPLWVAYQNGTISAAELQTTRFDGWARQLGVAAADLNDAFLLAMAEICTLLPGAQALIDALAAAGVRMGLITNGFTALQLARLERTGLRGHFDPLVISEQLGVAKPDVRIFEHALNRMGQPPREQVLMVGDNPHSDILGGLNAGLHTCWFNPLGHEAPEGIAPHHEVRSLNELQALLLG
jgi:putative hydrolase of the HAD superfamily